MATVTVPFCRVADGSISLTYDDITDWVSAIVVAGLRSWFVSVTDSVTGQTASRIAAAGTYPVPANTISVAALGSGLYGRLSILTRYPA